MTQNLHLGDAYSLTSPTIEGFLPDILTVSGIMGDTDLTVIVTYTAVTWDGGIATSFANGTGTQTDPYIIETAPQLAYLASKVNSGTTYQNQYIKLAKDIILNDTSDLVNWDTTAPANNWTAIGTDSKKFQGIFNGNDCVVRGIYINTSNDYQGLFGYCDNGNVIINLRVEDGYIKGGSYIGAIAGYINGSTLTVDNCRNTASVSGVGYVGGIVGYGAAARCFNTGAISGSSYIGGIVGSGAAEECYNAGAVSGQNDYIGGIVGGLTVSSKTQDNYNIGAVTGNQYIGGIVGRITNGYLNNCFNAGDVTGSSNIGGVTGYVSLNVSRCYYLAGTASGGINGSDVADKATVMTEAQMKQQSNFMGWDFTYKWFMDTRYCYEDGTTKEYPQLQAFGDFSSLSSSAVWDGTTDVIWEGTGTESSPYLISSAQELAGLAENSLITNFSGKYFKLTADIVLNDSSFLYWQHNAVQWIPIGNPISFSGTFNGDGHTVSGIYIDEIGFSYGQGLFGFLSSGDIKNIGVIKGYIRGGNNVGAIVGSASGPVIDACYNTCTITATGNQVGGIIGNIYSNGSINGCYNAGTISGRQNIGGIIGTMTLNGAGVLTNCYNTGSAVGISQVGGIVGSGNCDLSNCYNAGMMKSVSLSSGIIGNKNSSTISHCYYLSGTAAGGIGGANVAGQAEALTDAQMRLQPSFIGWNFDTIWEFSTVAGDYYYPTLNSLRESIFKYTLTINYRYLEGGTASESVIKYLYTGDTYSVASPSVSGYCPDIDIVSGTIGEENLTVTVTYIWDGSAAAGFASGTGTETDPYLIETAPQLAFLASSVNSGTTYSQTPGGCTGRTDLCVVSRRYCGFDHRVDRNLFDTHLRCL